MLPIQGLSGPHIVGLAIAYAVVAVVFALATRAHGNDVFDKGSALGGLPAANPEE